VVAGSKPHRCDLMTTVGVIETSTFHPFVILDIRDGYLQRRRRATPQSPADSAIGPLKFTVTALQLPAETLFPLNWTLRSSRTMSGAYVCPGEITDRSNGEPSVLRSLPHGLMSLTVRITSSNYQPQDHTIDPAISPRDQVPIELWPSIRYPFEQSTPLPGRPGQALLRGTVTDSSGIGISGATASSVNADFESISDANGAWVLAFPDSAISNATHTRVEISIAVPANWSAAGVTIEPDDLPSADSPGGWSAASPTFLRTFDVPYGATGSASLRLRAAP
jgi:hypothetical protein